MKFWVCQDKKLINMDRVGYNNILVTVIEQSIAQNTQICRQPFSASYHVISIPP